MAGHEIAIRKNSSEEESLALLPPQKLPYEAAERWGPGGMELASRCNIGAIAIVGAPRPMVKEPNSGPLEAVNCKWFAFTEVQPKSRLSGLDYQGHVTSGIQCQSLEAIAMGTIKKSPPTLAFL